LNFYPFQLKAVLGKKELATDIRRHTQIKNLKRKVLDTDIKAGSGEWVSGWESGQGAGRDELKAQSKEEADSGFDSDTPIP
jgi:hypothetical protein